MDSLIVWNLILAALLLVVVFINGVNFGLLLVKWVVAKECREGPACVGLRRGGEDGGSDAQQRVPTGTRGVWQVVDSEWRKVECGGK